MRRTAQRLRGARVSLSQLLVVASVSAVVSALIVISATAQTGPERAVIAALRERHVIHATAPATMPKAPAAAVAPVADAAPAPAATAAGPSAADSAQTPPAPTTSETAPSSTDSSTDSQASSSSGDPGSGDSGSGTSTAGPTPAPKPTSKIKHVFVIALSTPSYDAAFGKDSSATYLNSKLRPKGVLLTNYHTLGAASSMPDYIALVSGQDPNHDTAAGCPTYNEFHGATTPNKRGQVTGTGCVYPNTALTIGDQLDSADLPWRAYVEGMTAACQHPDSGAVTTTTGDYTPTLNPFVFFHSLLDLGGCQSDDLPYSALGGALRSAHRTPALSYIAPDACDSGTGATCPAGQPQGIAAADAFLQRTVPAILHSAAYRANGALMIVFTATPAAVGSSATGPVRTGALVLSPYARAGTTARGSFGPYAVLRTIEDIFGLDGLGSSKQAHGFSQNVLTDSRR